MTHELPTQKLEQLAQASIGLLDEMAVRSLRNAITLSVLTNLMSLGASVADVQPHLVELDKLSTIAAAYMAEEHLAGAELAREIASASTALATQLRETLGLPK